MSDDIQVGLRELVTPSTGIGLSIASIGSPFKCGSAHLVNDKTGAIIEPIHFGDYYKFGHESHDEPYSQWVLRVKNGKWPEYEEASDILAKYLEPGTVIVPMPSSDPEAGFKGMGRVVEKLVRKHGMINGTGILIRHTAVESSHKSKGVRTPQKHLDSIKADVPAHLRDKKFLLLDDIFTSGSTMTACVQILKEVGVEDVACATFGRTV